MDWGLGNPNKTAVLIGSLMVVSWAFARFRNWGFWVALAFNLGLGIALIHTYSRGGLLAAGAGQVIWWIWAAPRFSSSKRWAGAVLLLTLAVYANLGFVGAGGRILQGLPGTEEDRSISNRLTMWQWAPRMMLDAPRGWGAGRSGDAYTQWYQDKTTRYRYRTLVNSHLTRLVEFGWLGRFAYVFGWLVVLGICWPAARSVLSPISLGCWVVFGVGGAFSTIDEARILWILPLICLLGSLGLRIQTRNWNHGFRNLVILASISAFCLVSIALWGLGMPTDLQIRGNEDRVEIGPGSAPPIVLIKPDSLVLGLNYGAILRQQLELREEPAATTDWMVIDDLSLLPPKAKLVVFSGAPRPLPELANVSSEWLWLNPREMQDFAVLKNARQCAPGNVFIGDLRNDPSARLLRSTQSETWQLSEIGGKQVFLSNWVQLLNTHHTHKPL